MLPNRNHLFQPTETGSGVEYTTINTSYDPDRDGPRGRLGPAPDAPNPMMSFKALADPTRRAILDLLADGTRTSTEIADALGLPPPNASYHLDLLRQSGLVVAEKDGRFVRYTLATTALEEATQWLLSLLPAPAASPKAARDAAP